MIPQQLLDTKTDKNGHQIYEGDEVDVAKIGSGEMHLFAFRGTVVTVYPDRDEVCVLDQDNDCFDVSIENITLVED